MHRTVATLIAAAAALAAAGSASAQEVRLSYKDLDLGRPKDANTFRLRVEAAAAYACRSEVSTGSRQGGGRGMCETRARRAALDSLPAETRAIYQAALNGRASETLSQARAAPATGGGGGSPTSNTLAPQT